MSEIKDGYTRLFTPHILNNTSVRNTLWLYLSYDEGKTWTYSKKIWSDPELSRGTGASDINVISDGVYGIVHGTSWDSDQSVEIVLINLKDLIGTNDESQVRHTHIGGMATIIKKAKCAICGKKYGNVLVM